MSACARRVVVKMYLHQDAGLVYGGVLHKDQWPSYSSNAGKHEKASSFLSAFRTALGVQILLPALCIGVPQDQHITSCRCLKRSPCLHTRTSDNMSSENFLVNYLVVYLLLHTSLQATVCAIFPQRFSNARAGKCIQARKFSSNEKAVPQTFFKDDPLSSQSPTSRPRKSHAITFICHVKHH